MVRCIDDYAQTGRRQGAMHAFGNFIGKPFLRLKPTGANSNHLNEAIGGGGPLAGKIGDVNRARDRAEVVFTERKDWETPHSERFAGLVDRFW